LLDSLYKNFIISLLIVTVGSKDISLEQPINNNNIKTIVSGEYTQPVPYLFLDKTGSDALPDPTIYTELVGRQIVRINLYLYADSIVGSRTAVYDALSLINDFNISLNEFLIFNLI
jgi:hypothetical protein